MHKRVVTLFLALAVLATACGDDDDDGGGSGQGTDTTTAEPTRGGTLVVALDSDPGSLNPAVTSNASVHIAAEPMFNGLVGLDNEGRPAPELAERWTIDDGGRQYTFTLRDGVRWHDGRPFVADDVKFSFEKALLPLHARTRASLGAASPTIETPDQRTVVFRFAEPYAPLLQQLNVTEAPIIPKHVYEGCTDLATVAGCPANNTPVGTGPFKLTSYTAQEIRLARNPDYFRAGLPYLDELVQRVIPDRGTQVTALKAGEVDWLWTTPGPEVAGLRGDRNVGLTNVARGPGGGNCVLTLAFNLRPPADRPPILTDLRVRQAVAAGINRQQAADQILFGQGQVAPKPIHSALAVAAAPGLDLPDFDLARSRRLLDEAGWRLDGGQTRVARGVEGVPDGTELTIDMDHFTGQQADYAQALRGQLREVGINAVPKQMDNPTLSKTVFADRAFDTAIISYCNESDPQIGVRRQYHSSQISSTAFSNGAAYSNPDMDRLWDQSAAETVTERRTPIFRQIQELAVRDLPYWWLAETENTRAYRSACSGFNFQNTGLFAEGASCRR
jgi:peptide/nickel transport system substrate-binding protein